MRPCSARRLWNRTPYGFPRCSGGTGICSSAAPPVPPEGPSPASSARVSRGRPLRGAEHRFSWRMLNRASTYTGAKGGFQVSVCKKCPPPLHPPRKVSTC